MESDTEQSVSPFPTDDFDDDIWPQKHETAYRVYESLWQDFYDWEEGYCVDALSGLTSLRYRPPDLPKFSDETSDYFPTHDEVQYFQVEDFNTRTGRVTRSTLAAEPQRQPKWVAYPRYNTCTSASRNVPAAPVNAHLRIHFIPFSDDETFDYEAHLKDFEDFKWQNDFIDPDRQYPFP